MHQDPTPFSDEVALDSCHDLPPVAVVTTVAPVEAQQTLYVAAFDRLYAVHASDGTVRWLSAGAADRGADPAMECSSRHAS